MKKVLLLAVAALVVSIVASSCRAHKGCEAYSKVETKQAKANI